MSAGEKIEPLREAPTDLDKILADEVELTQFVADDVYKLGTSLHQRIQQLFPGQPVAINITQANSNHLVYHSVTASGTLPDNDSWISRKRNTVLRFGVSSYYMGRKFDGNQEAFAEKFVLGERAGDYAIHGGGVPIKVKNVDGLVGVAIVSGLKQEHDHMLVIEALQKLAASQQ